MSLVVHVLGAREIIAADRGNTSDPYWTVALTGPAGREIRTTRVEGSKVKKTLTPSFTDPATTYSAPDVDIRNVSSIEIKIRDWDRFGSGTDLGMVTIDLDDLPDGQMVDQWYPLGLCGKMRNVSGDVHVQVTKTMPSEAEMAAQAAGASAAGAVGGLPTGTPVAPALGPNGELPNELRITLVQGRNLRAMDRKTSDPLVMFTINGAEKKSTIKKKTLTPSWNESFRFGVEDGVLEVVMEDEDMLSNDFMGQFQVPLNTIGGEETRAWYTLLNQQNQEEAETRGEVELGLSFSYNPDATPTQAKKKGGFMSRMTSAVGIGGGDGSSSESEGDDDDGEGGVEAEDEEPEKSEEEKEEEAKALEEARAALASELGDIEIKSGDYQVQVHIIEVRDLAPRDANGLSDPIVYIEAFGEKVNTVVKSECLSCVFDELFIINKRNLDKDEVENGTIKISVMDADTLTRNDEIGAYQFDASYVYFQKDHELHKVWLGLIDDTNPENVGIQGYLKCSVSMIGPGDKLKVHDADEEEDDSGPEGNLLMPPAVKQETNFLVCSIHRAEGLPKMDTALVGKGGLDAFVQAEFASMKKPIKTKVKSKKGDREKLSPKFNEQLWMPVTMPTMSSTISLSVWDWDRLAPNDCVAHFYEKFALLQKLPGRKMGPRWYNLYGAPLGVEFGKNKDKMNRIPEMATTYRGRVLMSMRVDEDPKGEHDAAPHKQKCRKCPASAEPATRQYVLRGLVVSGSELPKFRSITNPGKFSKMQVKISIGLTELLTERVDNRNGLSEWFEFKEQRVTLPEDLTQCPDVFVYLCKGKVGKDCEHICWARYKAADLVAEGFRAPVFWQVMREDDAINSLSDDEFPGSILLRLGFGTAEDAAATAAEWQADTRAMQQRSPYQVRVHLYQGRSLPAADSNGSLDPYVKINYCGNQLKTKTIKNTRDPLWYQTFSFDVELPPLEYAPQVNVQLYDWDQWDSDDYCGTCFINMRDAFVQDDFDAALPDPKYYSLFLQQPGDSEGEILVSVQLIRKDSPAMTMPALPNIEPEFRECFLEIIALGMRNMKPYKFLPINMPYVDFEIGDKTRGKQTMSTKQSKKPSGDNPNFLERIILPCRMPVNTIFAGRLMLTAKDVRLGGFNKPVVGTAAIDLMSKIPWSPTYVPPQADAVADIAENSGAPVMEEHEGEEGAEESKGEEPVDLLSGAPTPAPEGGEAKAAEEEEEEKGEPAGADPLADGPSLDDPTTSITDVIRARAGQEDTGAGVFGALLHVEEEAKAEEAARAAARAKAEKAKAKKGKKKGMFSFGRGGGAEDWEDPDDLLDEEEEEDEPPKYMINRETWNEPIETRLDSCPFETYELFLGQKFGNASGKSDHRVTGVFKGLIRIIMNETDPCLFDVQELLKPQPYQVRVYILRGLAFAPMDVGIGGRPGKSDPYIKMKLGKSKVNDRKNYIDDVTDPLFYRHFEMNAELPGASQLVIESYDYDFIGGDDLIGRTTIDLEDRYFEKRWQALGQQFASSERLPVKPIETRSLYVPTSNNPQGTIEMWVDIVTPSQAGAFEPDDVALPPPKKFELRVIIYKAKNMVSADTITDMNDLFFTVWPEGMKKMETDIHWRAKKGKGSFNWRMLWEIELGPTTMLTKFPYLHLQAWDKDIIGSSDCIAEYNFNMGKYFKRCFKHNSRKKLFETPRAPPKGGNKSAPAEGGEPAVDTSELPVAEQEQVGLLADEAGVAAPVDAAAAAAPVVEEASVEGAGDVEMGAPSAAVQPAGEPVAAGVDADADAADLEAGLDDQEPLVSEEAWAAKGSSKAEAKADEEESWLFGGSKPLIGGGESSKDAAATEEGGDGDAAPEEDNEFMDFVNNLKEMAGIGDNKPPDSSWVTLERDGKVQGRVCWGIEIVPLEDAMVNKVGRGRGEPNTSPFLAPPVGRLKFSLNPFSMMMQLLGPAVMGKVMCFCACAACMLLLVFCQPVLNLMIAIVF